MRKSLATFAAVVRAFAQETKIEPVKTEITVNEKIAAEAPASITVLPKLQIQETPGVNVDDRLRSVPGFTLFRRSSSLVAIQPRREFRCGGSDRAAHRARWCCGTAFRPTIRLAAGFIGAVFRRRTWTASKWCAARRRVCLAIERSADRYSFSPGRPNPGARMDRMRAAT